MAKRKYLKDGSVAEWYIQKQILDWLKTTGLIHYRQNSGKVHANGRSIFLGPDGINDLVVIVPPNGRFIGLECKSAKGRLHHDQVVWAKKLTASGGLYYVVRSLEQAQKAVADAIGQEAGKKSSR